MERYPGTAPRETGSNAQEGSQATEQARQQGQQLARQGREQADQLANRGAEQVKSQLANQKHNAAQRMRPIQTALQETAHQLRNQGQDSVARYADRAADQVERFSGYLRETDVDEIMDEVRDFARSRPALFLGGAAALGFLGTRFLKSSSEEGASGGHGSPSATSTATGGAADYGTAQPSAGSAPMSAVEEPSTPAGGQPAGQREGESTQPPRGA